jgi:uncharacterized membrane protein YgcG
MKALLVAVAAFVFAIVASGAVGGCSSSSSSSPVGSGAVTCTSDDGATCPSGAGVLELCVTGSGQCTGAYFTVGSQTINCNSCMDTTACQEQAYALCYGDAGSGSSSSGSSSGGGSSSGSSSGGADAAGE